MKSAVEKTPGAIRKEVYEIIHKIIGRPLTEIEHKEVKHLIYEHGQVVKPIAPQQKILREWTCWKCLRTDTLSKDQERRRVMKLGAAKKKFKTL